jgi:dienelactone hydrolase
MWPAEAREHVTVRHVQDATHAFDSLESRQYHDPVPHAGRAVTVNIIPNPEAAADARKAVVSFFVKHLKP